MGRISLIKEGSGKGCEFVIDNRKVSEIQGQIHRELILEELWCMCVA